MKLIFKTKIEKRQYDDKKQTYTLLVDNENQANLKKWIDGNFLDQVLFNEIQFMKFIEELNLEFDPQNSKLLFLTGSPTITDKNDNDAVYYYRDFRERSFIMELAENGIVEFIKF